MSFDPILRCSPLLIPARPSFIQVGPLRSLSLIPTRLIPTHPTSTQVGALRSLSLIPTRIIPIHPISTQVGALRSLSLSAAQIGESAKFRHLSSLLPKLRAEGHRVLAGAAGDARGGVVGRKGERTGDEEAQRDCQLHLHNQQATEEQEGFL